MVSYDSFKLPTLWVISLLLSIIFPSRNEDCLELNGIM